MKVREIAELFDVSSEELLRTIATEIYDVDLKFSPDELSDEVLEREEAHLNKPTDEGVRSGIEPNAAGGEEETMVQRLINRGKVGLGLLVVLLDSNRFSPRINKVNRLLADLGETVVQDSVDSVQSGLRNCLQAFQEKDGVAKLLPLLQGVSSIYPMVVNRWLDRQSRSDRKQQDSNGRSVMSNETDGMS